MTKRLDIFNHVKNLAEKLGVPLFIMDATPIEKKISKGVSISMESDNLDQQSSNMRRLALAISVTAFARKTPHALADVENILSAFHSEIFTDPTLNGKCFNATLEATTWGVSEDDPTLIVGTSNYQFNYQRKHEEL